MKKKFLLVILVLFVASIGLAACPPPPEKPECPEGMEVVEEATWVKGHKQKVCKQIPVYGCPAVQWRGKKVFYVKSQDPTKCHRPSDATLKNVYKMGKAERKAFKKAHKEWKKSIIVGYRRVCRYIWIPGYWTDPVCELPPPPKEPCKIRYYELVGARYPCYLERNLATDKANELPERFAVDGVMTEYGQSECNKVFKCEEGWTEGNFEFLGKVNFKCNLPCLDCAK